MMNNTISIEVDGIWAGSGILQDGQIRDCGAVIPEAAYAAIEAAIQKQPGDGRVVVDAVEYTWTVDAE